MARLKAAPEAPVAFYHCVSRVVDRRFIFGDAERNHFVRLMRAYEEFCGVRVLTYVVMSNHFHILVEVPRRPDQVPPAEVILQRIQGLHGELHAQNVRALLAVMAPEEAAHHLLGYWNRMHDVSWFIRLVKQRFSQWYNGRMDRCGTLWEQRFKSVLVEGAGDVLATVAAYIDLNPVRAGIVADPKDYRWCGYSEALAGIRKASDGIRLLMNGLRAAGPSDHLAQYRIWLYGQGDSALGHGGLSQERVQEVIRQKGSLPLAEYLRCRVRYFVDGTVLGSRPFVEGVFEQQRWRFGPSRRTGARRLRWVFNVEMYSLRDLRLNAVEGSLHPESGR